MALLSEILSHKNRFLKTSILFFSFVVLGLTIAVIGPTLLDLRQAVNANSLEISVIFPVGSVGYLLGSIAGGVVYEHFDSQLSIAFFVLIMTVCNVIIPWNRSVISLSATQLVMGLGGGGLDTAGNVWLLHMWGKKSAPFMQALHFTFGLGAFIAPLIAEPFLSNKKNVTEIEGQMTADDNVMTGAGVVDDLMIWCPYTIIGGCGLITVVALVIMYFIKSSDKPHPSISNNESLIIMTLKQKILILFIASIIFHSYCGLEIAFGRFMTTFAFYSDLHLNKSKGAYMTSAFWGTFTLCRLLAIFIVDFVGTTAAIWADIAIVMVSNFVLIFFGNTSEIGLWIGVSLMGIGTSSIFPTLLSFIEELFPVTSRIGSLFLVVACLGEFTIPFIVGYYVEKYPLILIYVTTIAICLSGKITTPAKSKTTTPAKSKTTTPAKIKTTTTTTPAAVEITVEAADKKLKVSVGEGETEDKALKASGGEGEADDKALKASAGEGVAEDKALKASADGETTTEAEDKKLKASADGETTTTEAEDNKLKASAEGETTTTEAEDKKLKASGKEGGGGDHKDSDTCGMRKTDAEVKFRQKLVGAKAMGRIVGGVDALDFEFPWHVSIQIYIPKKKKVEHFCGGAVISEYWIVTAAHCLDM
ncbi:unnamed protein product [Medioppia subpectinata]|uniref:Sodium-dependent glucose transporter 1 n=1 Tax=Medioppia subpectinata TaxID=1979941 RepID=A0A7R9L4D6_9ACAR|nr:unnamed protein product [Medioppia subpectinata]CAG2115108.1 unnamed protein product [Medioppia subpectinata]